MADIDHPIRLTQSPFLRRPARRVPLRSPSFKTFPLNLQPQAYATRLAISRGLRRRSRQSWVARLWNVSEERVINAQVNFTTTPFNARSLRFQGVPPRNLQTIRSKTKAGMDREH